MKELGTFDELMTGYNKVCQHYLEHRCVGCPFSPENNTKKTNCRELLFRYPKLAKKLINKSYELLAVCADPTNVDIVQLIAGPYFNPEPFLNDKGCAGFICPADISCEQCVGCNFWSKKFDGSVELDDDSSTLVIKIKLPGGNN